MLNNDGNRRIMIKRTEYVVGFFFDKSAHRIVLIEKQQPAWQRGQLNGVGGHIESGETPIVAMRREFQEETGLKINDWDLTIVMTVKVDVVYFFIAYGNVFAAQTQTNEKIFVKLVHQLPLLKIIPNLQWSIPLSLDSDFIKPVYVYCRDDREHPRGRENEECYLFQI